VPRWYRMFARTEKNLFNQTVGKEIGKINKNDVVVQRVHFDIEPAVCRRYTLKYNTKTQNIAITLDERPAAKPRKPEAQAEDNLMSFVKVKGGNAFLKGDKKPRPSGKSAAHSPRASPRNGEAANTGYTKSQSFGQTPYETNEVGVYAWGLDNKKEPPYALPLDRRRLESVNDTHRRLARRLAHTALMKVKGLDVSKMTPAERVMHRRNLADATRMAAKDVDSMSAYELTLHRRRLTYGVRVSQVMADLMDEIKEKQRR